MPELLLLRHAKSDWKAAAEDDFERPLAKRGRRAAPLMGKYLRAEKLEPNLVLCSSARRARETLELVSAALASAPEISYLKSLYLAPPSRMIAVLRRQKPETGRILLIAHNPGLQRLALELARGAAGRGHGAARRRLAEKFPTAALARLRIAAWETLGEAPAELLTFIGPRDLEGEA
ncbi:histidine phosphatase family protein [Pelagibius sp. CAU 1746]|uniref:SixA phosphatase family protein n=1 Tax=Pelagibius sp. CAU 1746 TaxID=3140370 RepID=UPI00325BB083